MMTREFDRIRVSTVEGVMTIKLFNPDRRNAIGPLMVNELLHTLEDAHADQNVRAIVLTGEGAAFCSGGDFSQMTITSSLEPKGDYADLLLAMTRTQKPIIARVNGVAVGGGLGLVAASTFAVAQADALLGTPEINVGLFPMMIMAVLARIVPQRTLVEMMLLGTKLTAEEARVAGILNRVVDASELDAAVATLTGAVLAKSPSTIAHGLRAFADQADLSLADALPMLRSRLAEVLATEDAREGLTAFLEKRFPIWRGR